MSSSVRVSAARSAARSASATTGCLLVAEHRDIPRSVDGVGGPRVETGRDDRKEVNAAAQFPQRHHVAVRTGRGVGGQRLRSDADEQRECGAVDVVDDRLGSVVERVEAFDAGELGAAELVGGGQVGSGREPGLCDRAAFGPQALDDRGVEVPERRSDDCRLDVTEYAATAHAVEVERVQPEGVTRSERHPVEVEGRAGGVDRRRGARDEFECIHGGGSSRSAARAVDRSSGVRLGPAPSCVPSRRVGPPRQGTRHSTRRGCAGRQRSTCRCRPRTRSPWDALTVHHAHGSRRRSGTVAIPTSAAIQPTIRAPSTRNTNAT